MNTDTMKRLCRTFGVLILTGCLLIAVLFCFSLYQKTNLGQPVYMQTESSMYKPPERRTSQEQEPESKYDDIKSRMKARVDSLNRGCKKLAENGSEFQYIKKSQLDHIIVDDRYKTLYCYVPKVACTNLKRVFLLLTGKMNESEPLQLKSSDVHTKLDKYLTYLDSFPSQGIKYRMLHYKKVIFVREPLERLLSAFRNKLLYPGNAYFKNRFGRRIIKNYRKNPSEKSLETGANVSFSEFVQYLVDPKTIKEGYNEHWDAFNHLCHPCQLRYNYIGKYETLDEDVDGLLKILQVDDKIKFPDRGDTYKRGKTEDKLKEFYKDIQPDMLKRLLEVYADDYFLFDYEIPPSLQKLIKSDS